MQGVCKVIKGLHTWRDIFAFVFDRESIDGLTE